MADTLMIPLRVLYTINSHPQYMLARSPQSVRATLLKPNINKNPESSTAAQRPRSTFGTTTLKVCLDTLCRASPELVQDSSRDFSVYFLDPLEAAPQSNNDSSDQGLAVGLGMLSWGLLTHESNSAFVTGTIVELPTGQAALQVRFVLKETPVVHKHIPTSLPHWSLPSTYQPRRPQPLRHSEPPLAPFQFLSSGSNSNATASTSTAAVPLWDASHSTMPPLKKTRTRSNIRKPISRKPSQSEIIVIEDDSPVRPTRGQAPPPAPSSPSPTPVSAAATTGSTHTLLGLLARLSSSSAQNTALLTALSAIDTSNTSSGTNPTSSSTNPTLVPNPALVDALKNLLTTTTTATATTTTTTTFSHNTSPSQTPDTVPQAQTQMKPKPKPKSNQDTAVLGNKQNIVKPATPRKPQDAKQVDSQSGPSNPGNNPPTNNEPVTTLQSLLVATSANENQAPTTPSRRKRTYSDFQEDRDPKRSAIPASSPLRALPSRGGNHHYREHVDGVVGPLTSPLRGAHFPRHGAPPSGSNSNSNSRNPIVIPDSPVRPTTTTKAGAASSSSSSSPSRKGKARGKKPYVVPEWARTNTATIPKLSEEAIRARDAEIEAKKSEREREKERRRKGGGRGGVRSKGKEKEQEKVISDGGTAPSGSGIRTDGAKTTMTSTTETQRPQLEQRHSLPVFAACSSSVLFPSPPTSKNPPQTPPRKHKSPRAFSTPSPSGGGTEGGIGTSLFTPTPNSFGEHQQRYTPGTGVGLFGSPLPGLKFPRPNADDDDNDEDHVLATELEEALDSHDEEGQEDDDGCGETPPDSLPIASSDCEDAPDADQTEFEDEGTTIRHEHEHWTGLPPSSPPAPSSPALGGGGGQTTPDEDDEEYFPLPAETGDPLSDFYSESYSEPQSEFEFDDDGSGFFGSINEQEQQQYDFNSLFNPVPDDTTTTAASEASLFQQFTHLPDSDDTSGTNSGEGAAEVEFDFAEFWKSVQPLMGENMAQVEEENAPEIDHAKLAEDVQALFSGCLM